MFQRRSIRLAMISVVALTLVIVPSASAVEPDVIPAGLGCSFDVLIREDHVAFGAHFGSGDVTLTNGDTEASILSKSRYVTTATPDPATNSVTETFLGRRIYQFYPGDRGPGGVVGAPGALLRIDGFVQLTTDLATDAYTAFSFRGRVTDLCAALGQ
jgi:hypothetical protein